MPIAAESSLTHRFSGGALFKSPSTIRREALDVFERSKKQSEIVTCPRVALAPNLTGSPDWQDAGSWSIMEDHVPYWHPYGTHVLYGCRPDNDSTLSATGHVCWHSSALYFFAQVTDDHIIPVSTEMVRGYGQDMIRLFFRTGREDTILQYRLYVDPSSEEGALCVGPSESSRAQIHGRVSKGSYNIGLRVPLQELGVVPMHGLAIGFDVQIYDCDDRNEGVKTVLSWAGGRWNPGYMYGLLRFTHHVSE